MISVILQYLVSRRKQEDGSFERIECAHAKGLLLAGIHSASRIDKFGLRENKSNSLGEI